MAPIPKKKAQSIRRENPGKVKAVRKALRSDATPKAIARRSARILDGDAHANRILHAAKSLNASAKKKNAATAPSVKMRKGY